ncbi:hypothetical protein QTP70_033043 [Hemibagrus guttatus]|uniref:Uncharacterized protein n=1 Tax=Hemibagrus guttatus TaxID=175788 RepID=A0AAE0US98_9TELE|nr:hypothetical protein QTP70_033043 [Hemibagrus guttatus]
MKRLAKKKWDMDRTEENRQEYKELQRRVKREVSKAKQKAYDELYTRLDTREGEKDLYRLARQRDRDGKDVQQGASGVIGHQGRIHPGRSANPSQGTHTLSFTHTVTHYGQFRDANHPTMHVFGPGEETEVPGGNPRGMGRTRKLHTHMAEAGIEPPTLEV